MCKRLSIHPMGARPLAWRSFLIARSHASTSLPSCATSWKPLWRGLLSRSFGGRGTAATHPHAQAANHATPTTAQVLPELRKFDLLRGTRIRVHHRRREENAPEDYDAMAEGIDETGALLIRTDSGTSKALVGEEISVRPTPIAAD
eukprot:m.12787 g.12787  ORF g.12787 m.12787 type:complete len:146 (+) comp3259_c0_seq1:581-1018(+)